MLAGPRAGSHGESSKHGASVASETPSANVSTSSPKGRTRASCSCPRSSSTQKRAGSSRNSSRRDDDDDSSNPEPSEQRGLCGVGSGSCGGVRDELQGARGREEQQAAGSAGDEARNLCGGCYCVQCTHRSYCVLVALQRPFLQKKKTCWSFSHLLENQETNYCNYCRIPLHDL